ncbi:hypothetical protein E1091_06975 [Micromonospora fluostatini]|uniref:Uncharacterized protein n=1 Tax=Micromonospora fluostatini TaxID=1629071 RepID=A0ABY2DIY6_9ACTN|nr:hypothetical protein E1091_06975 [Micromonospora fluostatini]
MTATPDGARQPVRLLLAPRTTAPARVPLLDWIHRRPEYRAGVRQAGGRGGRAGFSDAVIIAVVAQALLPGLFNLLQSWVDQQRTEVSVRVQAGETEVEIQVTGRTNAAALVDQASRALQQAAEQSGRTVEAGPAGTYGAVEAGPADG